MLRLHLTQSCGSSFSFSFFAVKNEKINIFCDKIIRCFYEQKLHIYILNGLKCLFVWAKEISYASDFKHWRRWEKSGLGERIFCQFSWSAAGELCLKFSPERREKWGASAAHSRETGTVTVDNLALEFAHNSFSEDLLDVSIYQLYFRESHKSIFSGLFYYFLAKAALKGCLLVGWWINRTYSQSSQSQTPVIWVGLHALDAKEIKLEVGIQRVS